jgi:transposase InsO family protein
MDDNDKIAVFKYGLISNVIYGTTHESQTQYFKEIAKNEYVVPGKSKKIRFKWRTFKKWLHLYRIYGLDGLKPNFRKDKGKSRKIDLPTQNSIKEMFANNNYVTISNFYRVLLKENIIDPDNFTEATLRNYLKTHNLQTSEWIKKPRKSFEASNINLLWTGDFMHGPYVKYGKKKVKSYLCCIIDDYSRLITGGEFFIAESSLSLQKTLKRAVLTYGVPQKFYCDNGKVFVSGYIHMICARLGIALIHSKPYDSPSRGKIERFFLTVRKMFLPTIDYNNDLTIEILNELFKKWLFEIYHKKIHSGTNECPIDRFLNDIPNIKKKEITVEQAENYFYHTIYRLVKNDCTISFNNISYEVPAKYLNQKIEIRYSLEDDSTLKLFENNIQICELKKLDKHFNSENTIKYSAKEVDDV